jgi:hypothetical protein
MNKDRSSSSIDGQTEAMLAALMNVGAPLGFAALNDILEEKLSEMVQRLFLLCIPNAGLRLEQYTDYVGLVLGHAPSDEFLAALEVRPRRRRLTDDERIHLEARQRDRCALCGIYLAADANPHVDHVVPLSLGGADCLENMQLLCQRCNLGKHNLVGWQPGAPFLSVGITARTRYCVLVRDEAECRHSGCGTTSRDAALEVVTRLPQAKGGRLILDNLVVLCRHHATQRDQEALTGIKSALRLRRRLGVASVGS